VPTTLNELLFILKILPFCKKATLTRRSTVPNLSPHSVFPGLSDDPHCKVDSIICSYSTQRRYRPRRSRRRRRLLHRRRVENLRRPSSSSPGRASASLPQKISILSPPQVNQEQGTLTERKGPVQLTSLLG
jgi:hypothetical protein